MSWHGFFYFIAVIALAAWIFFIVRRSPGSFSRQNLSKSFTTLGLLALALIAFIGILVLLLRQ